MGGMKIITINIPQNWLGIFDELIKLGLYPSRSECIRVAIRDWMLKDLGLANLIESEEFLTMLSDSYKHKFKELLEQQQQHRKQIEPKKEKEEGYTQIGNKIILPNNETFTLVGDK